MFETLKYKTYRSFGGKSYKLVDVYSSKKKARKAGKGRTNGVFSTASNYRVIKKGNDYLLYIH